MDLVERILPEEMKQQSGPCIKRPDDFMDGYVLPFHMKKPLHDVYPETIHNDMEFLEEPHLYVSEINGVRVPASGSVTGFAHLHQEHFDGKLAISMMKNSTRKKWPRLEYTLNPSKITNVEELTSKKGILMVVNDVTVSVIQPNSTINATSESLLNCLREFSNCDHEVDESDEEIYIFERSMTDNEILYKWERNGLLKRNMGTEAHRNCELALEGLPFRWYDPEMAAFYTFLKDYMIPQGATIMSTEREIRSLELDIAGSVDAVFKLPDNSIVIVDWKLSDKLYMNMTGFKKMKKPLNHLDDCDGAGYALQTSIYQYLFEKEYGYKVSERILVSLSPENPFITSVPYLKNEVEYLMNTQKSLADARRNIEGFKCVITNRTLISPVRADGKIMSEKVAQMLNLEYEHTDQTRDLEGLLNREIEKIRVPVQFDPTGTTNWKKQMPKTGGIRPFS